MKITIVFLMGAVAVMSLAANKSPAVTLKDYYANRKVIGRIIDGTPAIAGQFPWQAAIYTETSQGYFFCGGALISDIWILTAAHCVVGAIEFTLLFGTVSLNNPELTVITNTAIVHDGYNNYLHNDVALIQLKSPITFTHTIQPIRLPPGNDHTGANVTVRVSGWGKISDSATSVSPTLNWVDLTTISNGACSGVYGTATIISSTLCAVGDPHHSTCSGDSGGPLITIDDDGVATHRGVVSFVSANGCASGSPSGYVRTASILAWIAEITDLDV